MSGLVVGSHEEDLAPNLEEEALPSNEELEVLMVQAENPVNKDTIRQVRNDDINSNITAGDA
eukprot:9607917-Ditylum_brightwellii.AAC.1